MKQFGVPLNALRAFEAAARLKSFSKAAAELHVTHSTISHHIKNLEGSLGRKLFIRESRQVKLTKQAENLSRILERSFRQISAELSSLDISKANSAVKVAVTPSFANKWLVPNLKLFRDRFPHIEVEIYPSLDFVDFSQEQFNLGIRTGLGHWSGLEAELLIPVHMTPLCAPSLLAETNTDNVINLLQQHTLIHADVSQGVDIISEWHEWAMAANIPQLDTSTGLSFNDPGIALQAAIDGLGIAMGYLELAQSDIAAGRLVQPFAIEVKHPWSYYLVLPVNSDEDTNTRLFCDWLKQL